MPQLIIDFDADEDAKLEAFKRAWGLSKGRTVRRMVREYPQEGGEVIAPETNGGTP